MWNRYINMRKLHFAIVVYMSSMCLARDISEQYNRFTENTFDGDTSPHNDMRNPGDSWQPLSRRNWIILNSETRKEGVSAATHHVATTPSNQRHNMFNSQVQHKMFGAQTKLNFQRHERQKQQHGHSHRLPMNYYTYNHSSDGNYLSPTAADVKLIEPYIVTISKVRTHKGSDSDAVLTRRVSQSVVADASSAFGNVVTLPKDVVGNLVSPQKEMRQDIENNVEKRKWGSHGESVEATATSVLDENNGESESLFDTIVADGAQFNEIVLPLQHTLDKVIYFCDKAKRLISNDDDYDDDDDINDNEDANEKDLNIEDEPSEVTTANDETPDKVQGHRSISQSPMMLSLLTSTSTGRSHSAKTQETAKLASIGTGRKIKKLKKKLSKFILPLLLAYKLKFLTLIPVLIGGLILLVGTTGLAGFFFALFTAVMSLKSTGGSKSIIVKKI